MIKVKQIEIFNNMKKLFYTLLLFLLVTSCETVNKVTISCMSPGIFNFPNEIKKVGVVNNLRYTFGTDSLGKHYRLSEKILNSPFHPDGSRTADSFAKALSDNKYFDEVVICDSALRSEDEYYRRIPLDTAEVKDLAEGLEVDAILSLDELNITAEKSITPRPDLNGIEGTISSKIQPIVSIYVPTHRGPVFTIAPKDSILWNEVGTTVGEVETQLLPPDSTVIRESCEYAGTIPVKYLIPHWDNENRVYFSDQTSTPLKIAVFYVERGNWKAAEKIWKSVYNKKKSQGILMRMSFNMALYCEVNSQFGEALKWIDKARTHLMTKCKASNPKELAGKSAYYYDLIKEYEDILKKRKEKTGQLKIQLSRFGNENK